MTVSVAAELQHSKSVTKFQKYLEGNFGTWLIEQVSMSAYRSHQWSWMNKNRWRYEAANFNSLINLTNLEQRQVSKYKIIHHRFTITLNGCTSLYLSNDYRYQFACAWNAWKIKIFNFIYNVYISQSKDMFSLCDISQGTLASWYIQWCSETTLIWYYLCWQS